MHDPPPYVCSRPFEWFEIHASGDVFLCCPAWMRRPVGNLLDASIEALWNGPVAREMRAHIHSGSFHGCNRRRCPWLVSATPPVQPAKDVTDLRVRSALLTRQTSLDYGPRVVNLCIDTACNLCCPSCRQTTDRPPAGTERRRQRLFEKVGHLLAPSTCELRLSGSGEPFASAGTLALLSDISVNSWPRLEAIHVHSNGLLWDAPLWQSLAGVHPWVKSAEISIDAADEATYGRNRGGCWQRLQQNLAFIATLPLELTVSCVVQANNYDQMHAFATLADRLGARAYFSQLVNWGTFAHDEYALRAVHRPEHPHHGAFLQQVARVSGAPHVTLGNLLRV